MLSSYTRAICGCCMLRFKRYIYIIQRFATSPTKHLPDHAFSVAFWELPFLAWKKKQHNIKFQVVFACVNFAIELKSNRFPGGRRKTNRWSEPWIKNVSIVETFLRSPKFFSRGWISSSFLDETAARFVLICKRNHCTISSIFYTKPPRSQPKRAQTASP